MCVNVTKAHSGDGYDLASNSFNYDIRKGDLFVVGWARVRRMCVNVTKGHSGDGYDLASNSFKYDIRKGDLFVVGWARVRRMNWGSISSELLMCGGGVRSILRHVLVRWNGSIIVLSSRFCVFVFCVHPVFNAAVCVV